MLFLEDVAANGILRQKKVSIVDNFSVCGKYVEFIDYKKLCSYQSRACEVNISKMNNKSN